ncbi:unnamed protein product [Pleuronectes platessa]|uniref:Uncharacterized protein n=1 Tax=Pleuronectes platessa TaxID=8262 RepID=A0A9N7UIK6_PLEPL|nr:unnamed protein product [Pleuronectes platessa]
MGRLGETIFFILNLGEVRAEEAGSREEEEEEERKEKKKNKEEDRVQTSDQPTSPPCRSHLSPVPLEKSDPAGGSSPAEQDASTAEQHGERADGARTQTPRLKPGASEGAFH